MNWIYLFVASVFEISWAVGLKYSDGLTKTGASIFTVATMILSFLFLSLAVKTLPLGVSYAIWTGIGVIGTTIYGILFFDEPSGALKIIFIIFIVTGIAGLKLLAEK